MILKRQHSILHKRVKAITLMEVLIVMAIAGIIAFLAMPNLQGVVTKAKESEAQIGLGHIHTLEQTYSMIHSKYSADLKEIDYVANKLVTEGGNANYRFEISSASATAFKAKAISVVDFDNDGTFNVWEIDQDKKLTEVTPD